MFKLFKKEMEDLRCQFGTSNRDKIGLRIPPFAFTEHGLSFLATQQKG
jgi:hypothetical protein